MVVGAFLRVYGLSDRGLLYWDEGKFALEGIRMLTLVRDLLGAHDPVTLGKSVGTAKPTHALLIALSYAVLGVHDYSPLYMNAACSILEIPLVFDIGRRLFGPQVGVVAAWLLAVSEYDIVYARSALSESDAALLLLFGFWLWTRKSPRVQGNLSNPSRLCSGAILGLAFTVNYRMIVYIAVFVAADLLLTAVRRDRKNVTTSASVWLCGLAIAPLAWQVIDLLAARHNVILFRNEILHRPDHYLPQVLYQLHEGKQSVVRFEPGAYIQWLTVRMGWWTGMILAASLVYAIKSRKSAATLVAAFVVIPYLVYVTAPFVVPRNLSAAVPFACLVIAIGLDRVWALVASGRGRLVVGAVVAAIALADASLAARLVHVTSGLAASARFVERHGGRAMVANEVMVFYLRGGSGRCLAPRIPYSRSQFRSDVQFGYRFAVIDQYSGSSLDHYIKTHAPLLERYPLQGSVDLSENLVDSENTIVPSAQRQEKYVRIYELLPLRGAPQVHPRYPGCSREDPL